MFFTWQFPFRTWDSKQCGWHYYPGAQGREARARQPRQGWKLLTKIWDTGKFHWPQLQIVSQIASPLSFWIRNEPTSWYHKSPSALGRGDRRLMLITELVFQSWKEQNQKLFPGISRLWEGIVAVQRGKKRKETNTLNYLETSCQFHFFIAFSH